MAKLKTARFDNLLVAFYESHQSFLGEFVESGFSTLKEVPRCWYPWEILHP